MGFELGLFRSVPSESSLCVEVVRFSVSWLECG